MITVIRNSRLNKVDFFYKGSKVYPVTINGNIATFENGEIVLF